MARITGEVLLEFPAPEICICLGSRRIATVLVSVPKAAVNEYRGSVLGEDEIGGAGKVSHMQSIAKPLSKQQGT